MGVRSSQSRGPGLNKTDGHLLEYFRQTFGVGGAAVSSEPAGIQASGGVISDYSVGADVFRAHVFTSSGTFNVTALATDPTYGNDVDFVVVAGGGGGGQGGSPNNRGGGGGAGGLRSNVPTIPTGMRTPALTVSVQPYTITVGAGGVGASISGPGYINPGSNSSIGTAVVASGGGGGGNRLSDPAPGNYPDSPEMAGGSGGGGGSGPGGGTGGPTVNSPDPLTPQAQGNAGGDGNGSAPNYGAGGGGGAGAAGQDGTTGDGGDGGNGLQVLIAGPTALDQPVGTPGTNPGGGYFAGGGGGGVLNASPDRHGSGGEGGGGDGGSQTDSTAGTQSTGGGGGGNIGKSGGSGIVVIRYKIATIAGTARASGGSISFFGGKTIHTFTSSGTFETTADWSATDIEYIVVGGGGGGGNSEPTTSGGGGGGAGAYRTGPAPIGTHPVSVNVQIGAGGRGGISGEVADGVGATGTESYFAIPGGNITSPGGGGGGNGQIPGGGAGTPGGSGGGGGYAGSATGASGTGDPFPGTIGATPANGWGGDGPSGGGSGGGGAGDNGSPRSHGGAGMQLPSTFRDPMSSVGAPGPATAYVNGDASGKFWVAGGGAGGHVDTNKGGGSGGPYAGAGDAPEADPGGNALINTGSGGGGCHAPGSASGAGGSGGSGIVLIAYPT